MGHTLHRAVVQSPSRDLFADRHPFAPCLLCHGIPCFCHLVTHALTLPVCLHTSQEVICLIGEQPIVESL